MKKLKIVFIGLYFVCLSFSSNSVLAYNLDNQNFFSLLKNYSFINTNPWDVGNIVKRGHRDLAKYPGIHWEGEGKFLFESSNAADKQTDFYTVIRGTMKDDTVRFNGRFIIGELNLLGGKNTLVLEPGTIFILDPGLSNENPKSLNFYNIADFNIKEGVKIQFLYARYGLHDININFTSPDSSDAKNNILMQDFSLINYKTDKKGYINIQNATVQVQHDEKGSGGNFVLSSNHETINLADAKLDDNGIVNEKTCSKLLISKGFSKPGGVFVINMGKYSSITTQEGSMQINASTTINMDEGSSINSHLLFRERSTTINIKDNTKVNNSNKEDNKKVGQINIHSITFGDGNNTINVGKNASLLILHNLNTNGGNTKILIGKSSEFTIKGETLLSGSNNYVFLDEQSVLNADLIFSSVSSNNNVVVNTGNSSVTLNGLINGSRNNDSLKLLGSGIFDINSSLVKDPLSGFNNIDLTQSRIIFNTHYKQTHDINISLTLLPNIKTEENPRIWFKGLAQCNDTNLNIKYKGVTKYLGNINDKYTLTLLQVGHNDYKGFTQLSDIGLKNINFTSAIYKLKYYIEQNRDLKLELEKYRTFKDAMIQDGNITHKEEYIVQIADFLDYLVKEKNEKYLNLLDELAMIDVFNLKEVLQGFIPVNNTILFNVNNSIANEFNNVILDAKPYKLVKNELTVWSNFTYFKANIKNFQNAKLTSNNQLMFGAEYKIFNFLKLGASFGYSHPQINSSTGFYDATINNYYYSIYGVGNITKDLSLDCNISFLSSNYNLNRYIKIENNKITSCPKFNQVNLDALVSYKIRLQDLLIVPYVSASYVDANMNKYIEKGEKLTYKIADSNFSELKGGLGLKALTVHSFAGGIIMPSLVIGLYSSYQNTESTKAQFIDSPNIWIPFNTNSFDGLYGRCKIGFSYRLKDIFTLDFNTGFNVGKSIHSYDLGTSISIAL